MHPRLVAELDFRQPAGLVALRTERRAARGCFAPGGRIRCAAVGAAGSGDGAGIHTARGQQAAILGRAAACDGESQGRGKCEY